MIRCKLQARKTAWRFCELLSSWEIMVGPEMRWWKLNRNCWCSKLHQLIHQLSLVVHSLILTLRLWKWAKCPIYKDFHLLIFRGFLMSAAERERESPYIWLLIRPNPSKRWWWSLDFDASNSVKYCEAQCSRISTPPHQIQRYQATLFFKPVCFCSRKEWERCQILPKIWSLLQISGG